MSDTHNAPEPEAEAVEPIATPETFRDASEAARFLSSLAHAKREAPAEAEPGEPEEAVQVSGEEPEGEPEKVHAEEETPQDEAEEELPPIAPPVSMNAEEKESFSSLPREQQEFIARREQERERHFSRNQNESAEQRRAFEAEKQQVEQLRQQYESQLPTVQQAIQQTILNEFPDIKTMEDVRKMAAEDWPRYIQWDARTKELAHWQSEAQAAQQRQQQEQTQQMQQWASSQDSEVERELSSLKPTERQALAQEAKSMLMDYGWGEDEISKLWDSSILRSKPIQLALADAARYRIAKRTATKPAAKPVPTVQKPGTNVRAPDRAVDGQIAALEAKPSLKPQEAAQLLELKAQRRRATAS